jgi:ABC-type histidine transport system ATPase subunit
MHKGKIAEQGPPQEIFTSPKSAEFAKFIADIR